MFLIPLTGIDSRWLFVPNNTLTSDFGTWCCTLPSFSSAILFKTRLKFPCGKSTVKDFGCSFGCHFFQCFQQFILFNRLKAWHQPQCLSIVSVNLAGHCYFFTLLCSSSSILLTISGRSFASTLEWHVSACHFLSNRARNSSDLKLYRHSSSLLGQFKQMLYQLLRTLSALYALCLWLKIEVYNDLNVSRDCITVYFKF